MEPSPVELTTGVECLAEAMRTIRRKRGLRAADVAAHMGMGLRSYQYFEAGKGRIAYDMIVGFAAATQSDPIALMFTMFFRSPSFAVDCMDNKLATIGVTALEKFVQRVGPDVELLQPSTLVAVHQRLFKDLENNLSERDHYEERWMGDQRAANKPSVARTEWRRGRKAEPDPG